MSSSPLLQQDPARLVRLTWIAFVMGVVYTQLKDQTVLFQTIQFSIGHLFAHSLNVKHFYLSNR